VLSSAVYGNVKPVNPDVSHLPLSRRVQHPMVGVGNFDLYLSVCLPKYAHI